MSLIVLICFRSKCRRKKKTSNKLIAEALYLDLEDLEQSKCEGLLLFFFFFKWRDRKSYSFHKEHHGCIIIVVTVEAYFSLRLFLSVWCELLMTHCSVLEKRREKKEEKKKVSL